MKPIKNIFIPLDHFSDSVQPSLKIHTLAAAKKGQEFSSI
jgi:hypothetical protein